MTSIIGFTSFGLLGLLISLHGDQRILGFPMAGIFLVIPFFLFLAETVVVYSTCIVSNVYTVDTSSANCFRLQVSLPVNTSLKYKPSQYFYLWVPTVKLFAPKPFTASTSSNNEYIEFIIGKTRGESFTTLFEDQASGQQGYNQGRSKLYILGPFGGNFSNTSKFKGKEVVVVAADTGITPMLSLLHHFVNVGETERPSKIHFVFVSRDLVFVRDVRNLLQELFSDGSVHWINIHLHCSNDNLEDPIWKTIQTDNHNHHILIHGPGANNPEQASMHGIPPPDTSKHFDFVPWIHKIGLEISHNNPNSKKKIKTYVLYTGGSPVFSSLQKAITHEERFSAGIVWNLLTDSF